MKRNREIALWLLLAFALLIAGGCATAHPLDSGTKSLSANPVFIQQGGKTIYINYSNTTGHTLDLQPLLAAQLQAKGYQIVNRRDDADYVLNAQLSYLGYLKNHAEAPRIANELGLAAGAATGLALAATRATGALGASAAGVGAAAAIWLVGKAIENANTPEYYYAQLDVQIEQRLEFLGRQSGAQKPIEKQLRTITKTSVDGKTKVKDETITTEETGSPVETTKSLVRQGDGQTSSVVQKKVAQFSAQQTRFRTVVKGFQMPLEQAIPQVSDFMTKAVVGLF